jgi:hypothetical protein
MKPIETTADRLMLRHRPVKMGLLVAAVILIFAGLSLHEVMAGNHEAAKGPLIVLALFTVVFAVFVRQTVVILDRTTDAVVIRTASVFGTREKRFPLTGCKRATFEQDRSDSTASNTRTYRPVLVYQDGTKVPVREIYSSGPGAELTAKAINAWLKQRQG